MTDRDSSAEATPRELDAECYMGTSDEKELLVLRAKVADLERALGRAKRDAERLDFLERDNELFRRNQPITREAIDAAIDAEKGG